MKKIIGLFAILLLTIGVFGQSSNGDGPAPLCSDQPVIKQLERTFSQVSLNMNIYHFYENDKLYVLSYDTSEEYLKFSMSGKSMLERKIYLYRQDADGWKIASTLVKTDFWNYKTGDWEFITSNFPARIEQKSDFNMLLGDNVGYSEVNKSDNGIINMKVMFFSGKQDNNDSRNSIRWQYRWDEIVFIPQKDGMYLAATITK